MNALEHWLKANAQGIIDLLESMDDPEMAEWNPRFAAEHRTWKRERAEYRRKLQGAARRLAHE